MKKLVVGIDLGTTYSCVSVLNEAGTIDICSNSEGKATTPSVVLIDKNEKITVGEHAKGRITFLTSEDSLEAKKQTEDGFYNSSNQSVVEVAKRFIGTDHKYTINDKTFTPTFISGSILKKIKQDVESSFGMEIDSAVITVPANFNNSQRQETLNAAQLAGLNVDHIINEPTAAALFYSLSDQIDGIYAIYDFGGGTFDCSIVEIKGEEVKILGFSGVKKLGGRDIDMKILSLVNEKYKDVSGKDLLPKQYSVVDAERSKKELTSLEEIDIYIDGVEIKLTRKEFDESISTIISKTILTIDNAIDDAGIEIDNLMDVILVGGSSRIPLVREELKRKIGKYPKSYSNPDETVSKGAAVYAALKNQTSLNINQKAAIGGLKIKEITNVSLGTLMRNIENNIQYNVVIIPKGSRIPTKRTEKGFINMMNVKDAVDRGTNCMVHTYVTEGLEDTENINDVEVVWDRIVSGPNPMDNPTFIVSDESFEKFLQVDFTYSIDNNQVFKFVLKHPFSNKILINESISMVDGSLGSSKSDSNENLDDFDIK